MGLLALHGAASATRRSPPSHPAGIGIAVGAEQVVQRDRERQLGAALAAVHRPAADVESGAAVFADHLAGAGDGLDLASAGAALMQVGLLGLDFVIFSIQLV
jgi:hypothetical protein